MSSLSLVRVDDMNHHPSCLTSNHAAKNCTNDTAVQSYLLDTNFHGASFDNWKGSRIAEGLYGKNLEKWKTK
jgi:hypothetical protein